MKMCESYNSWQQLCNASGHWMNQLYKVKIHSQVRPNKMKKLIFLASLAVMLLVLGSCSTPGYVTTEPTYTEYARPERPSDLHIWIDGDWVYNRRTSLYVRQQGHWQKPSRGRTYIAGSWKSTPQGLRWENGRWQR